MIVKITVQMDDDEHADEDDSTGLTNEAYERLTMGGEFGPPPLGWLGEVQDVSRVS